MTHQHECIHLNFDKGTASTLTVNLLLMLLFVLCNSKATAQGGSQFYQRAPDIIPGTTPQMQTPDFWVDRMATPDDVVETPAGITEINLNYRKRIEQIMASGDESARRIEQQLASSPGLHAFTPDLSLSSPDSASLLVKDLLTQQVQLLTRRSFGNILGIEYADHELAELEKEMAVTSVRSRIVPVSAITVSDVRLRIIPALRPEFVGLTQTGKTRWDVWNLDVLPIASPVEILHRSHSGGHLLVLSDYGYGWVRSEAVATATSEEREQFIQPDRFIVAIGDRVPFYSAPGSGTVSGWIRMGARLPLLESEDTGVSGSATAESGSGGPVPIVVPVRLTSGELSKSTAWLAPDADVSVGYLPYTRRHVVEQAFKLVGRIYDWTGAWYGRNDGTVLRDIFKTFGFQMPANGVLLSMFTPRQSVVSPALERSEQYGLIRLAEPFLTIQASRSGHTLLYMGSYEGDPIVFDTNGYGYESGEGDILEIRRWGLSTLFVPDYFLNQEITMTEIR